MREHMSKVARLAFAGAAVFTGYLMFAPEAKSDVTVSVPVPAQTETMKDIILNITDMAAQYPEVTHVGVTVEHMPPGYYGQTVDTTIVINATLVETPGLLNEMMQRDIAAGFHKPGCTPTQLLAYHEFAHVLDGYHHLKADETVKQVYGKAKGLPLSGYSFTASGVLNPAEALAEAFTAVKCHSANSTERAFYDILVKS